MEIPKLSYFLACPGCDALFNAPQIGEGERVVCPRCRGNLFSRRPNFVHRATALVLAAMIFFIVANVFPFLVWPLARCLDPGLSRNGVRWPMVNGGRIRRSHSGRRRT